MRTLQSRPYGVKTIHMAKLCNLARKFHLSIGAGAGNASVADARLVATVVIFPPVHIVPDSIGPILHIIVQLGSGSVNEKSHPINRRQPLFARKPVIPNGSVVPFKDNLFLVPAEAGQQLAHA